MGFLHDVFGLGVSIVRHICKDLSSLICYNNKVRHFAYHPHYPGPGEAWDISLASSMHGTGWTKNQTTAVMLPVEFQQFNFDFQTPVNAALNLNRWQ